MDVGAHHLWQSSHHTCPSIYLMRILLTEILANVHRDISFSSSLSHLFSKIIPEPCICLSQRPSGDLLSYTEKFSEKWKSTLKISDKLSGARSFQMVAVCDLNTEGSGKVWEPLALLASSRKPCLEIRNHSVTLDIWNTELMCLYSMT